VTTLAHRLTAGEARALTDEIQQSQERTYALLLRAHEGEAWAALGYESWRDYATAEFNMSQSRAYQLLDQARVVRSIEAASDSTNVELPNEAQARELGKIPEVARTEVWHETLDRTGGHPTAAAVRETYNESFRDQSGADEVVDAEIVDEPADRPEPSKPKRRPLPEEFGSAAHDFVRIAERLDRLRGDDRFIRNRAQTHHRAPEIVRALESVTRLAVDMDLPSAQTTEEARRWWATSLNTISDALRDVANSLNQEQ
jgi:hypothetical protein